MGGGGCREAGRKKKTKEKRKKNITVRKGQKKMEILIKVQQMAVT